MHFIQAFREIEAESERRAAKEAEEARSQPGPLPVGLIALHAATLNGVPQAKKRRRGSISISRLGNVSVFDFHILYFSVVIFKRLMSHYTFSSMGLYLLRLDRMAMTLDPQI